MFNKTGLALSCVASNALLILVVGVFANVASLFAAQLIPGPSGALQKEIADATRRREVRLQSASMTLTHRILEPGGDGSSEREAELKVMLSGQKWRYEWSGLGFNRRIGALSPIKRVLAWDGSERRKYLSVKSSSKTGYVAADNPTPAQWQDLLPIAFAFRPISWMDASFQGQAFVLRSAGGIVDGHNCVVVDHHLAHDLVQTYWLDPACEYSMRRFSVRIRGKPRVSSDVSYEPFEAHGYLPTKWKTVSLNVDGAIDRSASTDVVDLAVNREIDPAVFQFEFPPDTWVTDSVRDREYIVRAESEKRMITRDELDRRATYPELLATEEGQAGLESESGWRMNRLALASIGIAAAICLLAAFLAKRRLR